MQIRKEGLVSGFFKGKNNGEPKKGHFEITETQAKNMGLGSVSVGDCITTGLIGAAFPFLGAAALGAGVGAGVGIFAGRKSSMDGLKKDYYQWQFKIHGGCAEDLSKRSGRKFQYDPAAKYGTGKSAQQRSRMTEEEQEQSDTKRREKAKKATRSIEMITKGMLSSALDLGKKLDQQVNSVMDRYASKQQQMEQEKQDLERKGDQLAQQVEQAIMQHQRKQEMHEQKKQQLNRVEQQLQQVRRAVASVNESAQKASAEAWSKFQRSTKAAGMQFEAEINLGLKQIAQGNLKLTQSAFKLLERSVSAALEKSRSEMERRPA